MTDIIEAYANNKAKEVAEKSSEENACRRYES